MRATISLLFVSSSLLVSYQSFHLNGLAVVIHGMMLIAQPAVHLLAIVGRGAKLVRPPVEHLLSSRLQRLCHTNSISLCCRAQSLLHRDPC